MAKRKAALRKRRPKPKQSAAMLAYWDVARSQGIRPVNAEGLTEFVHSTEGRVRVSLGGYLRFTPRPTADDLDLWAKRTALRLGIDERDVRTIARPVLRDRGLVRDGRPPLEERHALVESLIAHSPRGQSGRLPRGFWDTAARKVRESEVVSKITTGNDLRKWYDDHVKVCGAPTGDLSRRRARQQERAERAERKRRLRRATAEADKARWITSAQVAGLLGVDPSTIDKWVGDGRIPVGKLVGRCRRYDREAIVALRGVLVVRPCSATTRAGKPCSGWALTDDPEGRCEAHAKPAAACGTTSGYNAHRDREEAPCDLCKQANTRYHQERRERRAAGDDTDRRKRAA